MSEILVALLPLFLLLACLVAGHYPGHRTIVRLVEHLAPRPGARATRAASQPVLPDTHSVAGGLLIALGLATRPPPAPLPR